MPTANHAIDSDETVCLWKEKAALEDPLDRAIKVAQETEASLPPDHLKGPHGLKLRTSADILKHVTPYRKFPNEHKLMRLNAELIDVLIEREAAEVACDLEGILEKETELLDREYDLQEAILHSKPTTHKGLALKLKAINSIEWEDYGEHMAAFVLELENFADKN